MEFDKLGRHCEHENCNQKDFLPFNCDKCHKNLCFLHRSEYAHDCVNKDMNDMTSMDCPVCKKSFKLTKTEDPNEAWERHFSTTCTQIPGSEKSAPLQCASSACHTTLGPSNRFQCTHCRLLVCLGCRTPEVHKCTAAPSKGLQRGQNVVAAARVNKLSVNSHGSSNSKSSHTSSSSRSTSFKSNNTTRGKTAARHTNNTKSGSSSDNTLRGSAQRRMEQQKQRQATASSTSHQHLAVGVASPHSSDTSVASAFFDCPLCSQKYHTSAELVQHVDSAHNTPEPPNSLTSASTDSSSVSSSHDGGVGGLGPEVCPTCSRRFPDVMTLIQHAERAHAGLGEGSASSSESSGDKCRLS